MIVTEFFMETEEGVILNITYSDTRHYIISDETGFKYETAIDPEEFHRTYHESEEIIPDSHFDEDEHQ